MEYNLTDNKQLNEVLDDLRLIERTRLLCNTRADLERMVGFKVCGNGLARMGGQSLFMKDAIFRELAHIAKTNTELDLKTVIDSYQETCKMMELIPRKLVNEDFLLHLIDHYFGEENDYNDISCITKRAEIRHIPILLLMLMRILPKTTTKSGDVKDIGNDYKRLFALMRKTVNTNIPMQMLPALLEMEEEVRRQPSIMCRFHLIYTTAYILSAYGRISTREGVIQINDNLSKVQTFPDIEGIWTEEASSTMFWQFVTVANGFRLIHYCLNNEKKQLSFTEYFVRFYQDDKYTLDIVVHPKAIRNLVTSTPTPNKYFAYLRWNQQNDELTFIPISEDDKWFTLRRLKRNNQKLLQQVVDDKRYERLNNFSSDAYTFNQDLAAITEQDIFIHTGEGDYFKVPKSLDKVLELVHFGMNIGVLKFKDTTFIGFDDLNLFYDISDEEKRKEKGICVVQQIE